MRRILGLLIPLLAPSVAFGQARPSAPPDLSSLKVAEQRRMLDTMAMMHEPPIPADQADNGRRISVSIQTMAGPVGQVFVPPALQNAFAKAEDSTRDARYPSLYFTISASPVLTPVTKPGAPPGSGIRDVLYDQLDMRWLDAAVELEALDANEKALPCDGNIAKLADKSEFNFVSTNEAKIAIPERVKPTSLGDLADISELSAMVAKADAVEILHVTEQEYTALVADKSSGLKSVMNGGFVTRGSLEAFLGLQKKREQER